jgi:hypothetical protein
MNALGLRSIFIAASVQPITVHSLILPSNIKIQRSGSEFLDDSHVIRPAADLERWDDPRSGPRGTELARPHHLWYSRLVGRLAAWEPTLSFELSFSVLKEGGSQ